MRAVWPDDRIGGLRRWRLCDERDLMQVPDELRKCVCFVEATRGNKRWFAGTAFFISTPLKGIHASVDPDPYMVYVVTAAHVLTDYDGTSWDELRLCINTRGGSPDFIAVPQSAWTIHPASDTAVIGLVPDQAHFDYLHYPIESRVDAEFHARYAVTPGEDVLITGLLYVHPGKDRILPIVRTGSVAAFPDEPIMLETGEETGVLVEVRSIGGLSGSPAFLHLTEMRRQDQGTGPLMQAAGPVGMAGSNYLLGVVHGYFPSDEKDESGEPLNSGITVVTHSERIVEILHSREFADRRRGVVEAMNKRAPRPRPASRSEKGNSAERFEDLTRKLLAVPKDEAAKQKRKPKRARKPR